MPLLRLGQWRILCSDGALQQGSKRESGEAISITESGAVLATVNAEPLTLATETLGFGKAWDGHDT